MGGERSEMAEAGQRSRLFGTDGVRGVAGDELTASLALNLSVAAWGTVMSIWGIASKTALSFASYGVMKTIGRRRYYARTANA